MSPRGTRTPDARGGPAWKLTASRKKRIVNAVRAGNFDYVAAQAAGIGRSTFYRYLALGTELLERAVSTGLVDPEDVHEAEELALLGVEDDLDDRARQQELSKLPNPIGQVLRGAGWPEHEVLLVELVDELARAEAEGEVRLVTLWSNAAPKNWQAARDLLQRRWSDRWRESTEIVGAGGGPLQAVVVTDTKLAEAVRDDPEALALAQALLAKVAPSSLDDGADPEGSDFPGLGDGDGDEADLPIHQPVDDDGADEALDLDGP